MTFLEQIDQRLADAKTQLDQLLVKLKELSALIKAERSRQYSAKRYAEQRTGFKPGRPRKGEIRPVSPNAVNTARHMAAQLAREPELRDKLAAKAKKWRTENLERAREIEAGTRLRAKRWVKAEQPYNMTGKFDLPISMLLK